MDTIICDFSESEIIFLQELLSTVSPSGNEKEATQVISNYLKGYYNISSDVLGNLYVSNNNMTRGGLAITAHIDEVGFQITRIMDNGMVYVRNNGEPDIQTLPGTMLNVSGKSRDIIGVFGKISPHLQRPSDKSQVIELNSLWVDFGFRSKEEATRHLCVGDYIGFTPNFHIDVSRKICISKGLDNKFSAFILAVSLKRLITTKQPMKGFTAVFTVQEELGYRGAIVASQNLAPQKCICIDVGFATDIPAMKSQTAISDFYLHKGPGLCIAPDNNQDLTRELIFIAKSESIPYQISTTYKPTVGTETGRIQLTGSGTATVHISVPNRYMHSAVEMCSLTDGAYTVNLLMRYLTDSKW